ncbi:MAG: esterase, partial [Pirellulaceae bacterium]|nr:esterase [Pirellulaceae bacterium]
MADEAGKWSEETVGDHPCDVYLPPKHHAMKYVVIYLHGIHLSRLIDKQAFCEQFDRHGLAVVAPMTQRSWWTDRICPEFDTRVTAEQHVLQAVVPFVQARFDASPPQI